MNGKHGLHNQCWCIACHLVVILLQTRGEGQSISLVCFIQRRAQHENFDYIIRIAFMWHRFPDCAILGIQVLQGNQIIPHPTVHGCQLQNVLQMEENKTQLRLHSRYKLHCLQPNTQQDHEGELWRPPMKSNNSFQCLIIVVHILMTLNFNSYFHSTTL